MINIYDSNETNFNKNGKFILQEKDIENGIVHIELNGNYHLNIEINEQTTHFKHLDKIQGLSIMKVPTNRGYQLFRIREIKKVDFNNISIFANHIAFDLAENFIRDINIVAKNRDDGVKYMLKNTLSPHNFKCVVKQPNSIQKNLRLVRYNPIRALIGDDSNTFKNRFGGEYNFNNFDIEIYNQMGKKSNILITDNKNLIDFSGVYSTLQLATRIIPIGSNELLLPEYCIDSPKIKNYDKIYTKLVSLSIGEDVENHITKEMAQDMMRKAVKDMFEKDHVDEPYFSWQIQAEDLKNNIKYKNIKDFYNLDLGDTLLVKKKGIKDNLNARVLAYDYDIKNEKINNFTIGNVERKFTANLNSLSTEIKNIEEKFLVEIKSIDSTFDSKLEITSDKIEQSVLESNPDNLFANSVGRLGQEFINIGKHTPEGEVIFNTKANDANNQLEFLIKGLNKAKGGLQTYAIPVVENKFYTFGGDVKYDRGNPLQIEVMCWSKKNNSFSLEPDIKKIFCGSLSTGDNQSVAFQAPKGTKYINIYMYGQYTEKNDKYPYSHYYLKFFRLNEGKRLRTWCEDSGQFESFRLQTSKEIQQRVTNGKFESYAEQTAKQMQEKIKSSDVESIVTQNATSWGVSINGKLKGKNYNFDGNGFTIGGDGDVATHTTSSSKWKHSDGSYSLMGWDGPIRHINGKNKDYHFMTAVIGFTTSGVPGETTWIQLPDEFKNKNFMAYAVISDTWKESWDYGKPWVLQRMVTFAENDKADRPGARVPVQGYRTDKNYSNGDHRFRPIAGMLLVIA